MEICFFLHLNIFVHGLILSAFLDFETPFLLDFLICHVKSLYFYKPDGVNCLKNVLPSKFVDI